MTTNHASLPKLALQCLNTACNEDEDINQNEYIKSAIAALNGATLEPPQFTIETLTQIWAAFLAKHEIEEMPADELWEKHMYGNLKTRLTFGQVLFVRGFINAMEHLEAAQLACKAIFGLNDAAPANPLFKLRSMQDDSI